MTTCPLCGEPDHQGEPCYQKMREQWKREDFEAVWRDVPSYALLAGYPLLDVIED